MLRIPCDERPDWRALADEYGFKFYAMYGEPYWDESAYYQFSLKQIEQHLEDPTAELHQMCLDVVDHVVRDEALLKRFCVPEAFWDPVLYSWENRDPSLYSRLDFAYDGKTPAKLYENNADTPTSLYETGFWQWLWLETQVNRGYVRRDADQFNSVQEKLVQRFRELKEMFPFRPLHFSCCKDTEEDRGTVQYLQDCAIEAGIESPFVFIEDIGLSDQGRFTDLDDQVIQWMFKLYPWEFMLEEEFAHHIPDAEVQWIEPLWKSILSNKALLPLLWQRFENHPNLLPAYFSDDVPQGGDQALLKNYVKKPIFSREGHNISVVVNGKPCYQSEGPYGEEGYIIQAYQPLPKFGDQYTLIGSWLIDDKPAGISVREDKSLITQDLSRYLPHIILD